jgi:hypothetical protein
MLGDGSIGFSTFVRKLKAINPKVVVPWPSATSVAPGTMVYLNLPRHPDSDPVTGLWEVLAIPSPNFFPWIPKHDTSWLEPASGKAKWVRGWVTFLRSVRKMKDPWGRPVFSEKAIVATFGRLDDSFSSKEFKAELRESNKTAEEKINDKLRYKAF